MAAKTKSPKVTSLPRAAEKPRKSFSSAKAEKWVLVSAILSAVIYGVRHLVEGETQPEPAGSAARAFLGSGSPPDFGQWIIAYFTGYTLLSLMALILPELAAALAAFVILATFIESGGQLASDLSGLEKDAGGTLPVSIPGVASSGPTAPSPQSVGASVKNIAGGVTGSPGLKSVTSAAKSEGLVWDPKLDQYVRS